MEIHNILTYMFPFIAVLVGFAIVGITLFIFRKWNTDGANGNFSSSAPYTRRYASTRDKVALPQKDIARGEAQGMPHCKFFLSAKAQLQRDYVLVIDRSGSMSSGRRWQEACRAVKTLAPYVCKFDPDGITVILFSSGVDKFENIKSADEVEKLFHRHQPSGSTNLALALHDAFTDHFNGSRGATTILVVTDGCPDSQSAVERVIRRAANSVESQEELSVSFVQIGDDSGAAAYLEHLDDTLDNVKFDIVDTVTYEACTKMSFGELVACSIYD